MSRSLTIALDTYAGGLDFRDEFLTTESTPMTSPRTAEPGPGSVVFVETSGEYSISSASLDFNRTGVTTGDRQCGFYIQNGVSRVAGRCVVCEITPSQADKAFQIVLEESATVADVDIPSTTEGNLRFSQNANLESRRDSTTLVDSTGYSGSTSYKVAFSIRATGCFVLVKDGDDWLLLDVLNSGTTDPLYPGSSVQFQSCQGSFDFFKVTQGSYWTPTPLASDTFDRGDSSNLGTTDGSVTEESGGDGLAWTELVQNTGEWEISSNALAHTVAGTGGKPDLAIVNTGESNTWCRATINLGATGEHIGISGRISDIDNGWIIYVRNTDQDVVIVEVSGGARVVRASTGMTIATSTNYEITVIFDGQDVTAWVDGANRTTYGSASVNLTETSFGAITYSTTGNDTVTMNDLEIWPRYVEHALDNV